MGLQRYSSALKDTPIASYTACTLMSLAPYLIMASAMLCPMQAHVTALSCPHYLSAAMQMCKPMPLRA